MYLALMDFESEKLQKQGHSLDCKGIFNILMCIKERERDNRDKNKRKVLKYILP